MCALLKKIRALKNEMKRCSGVRQIYTVQRKDLDLEYPCILIPDFFPLKINRTRKMTVEKQLPLREDIHLQCFVNIRELELAIVVT